MRKGDYSKKKTTREKHVKETRYIAKEQGK